MFDTASLHRDIHLHNRNEIMKVRFASDLKLCYLKGVKNEKKYFDNLSQNERFEKPA